jgi:dipeptidyl aminopeptidase/acylaminoacyl peptidase
MLLGAAALIAMSIAGCASMNGGTMAEAELIPREHLFGNPSRAQARLSPDGAFMTWLAPDEGVMNVWIAPRDDLAAARALTSDRGRGIRNHFWALNGRYVLYVQDKGGDENFHAYAVDVATGEERNLTPFEGARAIPYTASWEHPDLFMIGVNNRDPAWFDVYRVNVVTGERTLVYQNVDQLDGFTFDHDLNLRLAFHGEPDGSLTIMKLERGRPSPLFVIPYGDALTSRVLGFDATNEWVYAVDSRGRDKSALVRINASTAEVEVIAQSDQADISNLMMHPTEYRLEAYAVNYLRTEWTALDDTVAQDLAFLNERLPGEIAVTGRTRDDSTWMVASFAAEAPGTYHLYDRRAGTLTELFSVRPDLEAYTLADMHPIEIRSRDGMTLVSYLTLPPGTDRNGDGRPERPLPMVLLVHGGPWGRDAYGYNGAHQWLANRGYAVLSVNFRASTGFGKAFVAAGDHQWGRKMHDDLLDGVAWAVDQEITTPDQVAIMGGSYGGYATLAGLAFTPDAFACGVDIVGPSNLNTLLESVPPYWASQYEILTRAIGDPRTPEGEALLRERSPLYAANNISKPLLIGQGANDPRVKQAESDQIVEAMRASGLPVTYVLFPDEGHGFARPENNLAFNAVAEGFLSACLGGRQEPIGDAFAGSSLTVLEGEGHVGGLAQALSTHEAVERGG